MELGALKPLDPGTWNKIVSQISFASGRNLEEFGWSPDIEASIAQFYIQDAIRKQGWNLEQEACKDNEGWHFYTTIQISGKSTYQETECKRDRLESLVACYITCLKAGYDEYVCSGCGRMIGAKESLWVAEDLTICEECHAKEA